MKFKSFKEFLEGETLTEHAMAGYGDWYPPTDRILLKSTKQLKGDFVFVDTVMIMNFSTELYKMKDSDTYILGVLGDEGFSTIFHIELKRRQDVEYLINSNAYKNIMNVEGVIVEKNMRGYGIAKTMYQYFVKNLKMTILSDEIQYHKARLTWKSLSNMDDVVVDIFNIDTGEIMERNVTLHHGEADWEFDKRVWDYSEIKKHIRLLLTKVL